MFGVMPTVKFEHASHGMRYIAYREFGDGRKMDRITQALFPHARIVPDIRMKEGPANGVGWVVPVDDTHFRLFHARKVPKGFTPIRVRHYENRIWSELSEEEHQRFPGDWEAQVGQGPITYHSDEHLATSDQGVVMLRRFLRRQLDAIAAGRDPAGVSFDPDAAPIEFEACNYIGYRAGCIGTFYQIITCENGEHGSLAQRPPLANADHIEAIGDYYTIIT